MFSTRLNILDFFFFLIIAGEGRGACRFAVCVLIRVAKQCDSWNNKQNNVLFM